MHARGEVVFDRAFIGMDGHFPGNPIVPGFCQVEACRALASETRGMELELAALLEAKLMRPLPPGQSARITLAWRAEAVEAVLTFPNGDAVARYLLQLVPVEQQGEPVRV